MEPIQKNQKNPGCPRRESQGLQPASLEPLRIRERRDSHGQKPPTRGDPGSRIFFMFLIFLIFSFFAFSKKSKKSKKIDFLVFRKKSKNEKIKKIQDAPAGRVKGSSQGSSLLRNRTANCLSFYFVEHVYALA